MVLLPKSGCMAAGVSPRTLKVQAVRKQKQPAYGAKVESDG